MIIAIPSMNRSKMLTRCVNQVKLTSPQSKIYVIEQQSKTELEVDQYFHYDEPLGIGKARAIITEKIHKDHPESIIIHLDDNTFIGEGAIDKVQKTMKKYNKFAWIGALNAFKVWKIASGMTKEEAESNVHFAPHIGAYFAAINPEFISEHGNFRKDFIVREDVEMCARAWATGWYVGMIDVNINHAREKGRAEDHPFHPRSKEMFEANGKIKSFYPDHFKTTKGNKQLRRRFKFPDETFLI